MLATNDLFWLWGWIFLALIAVRLVRPPAVQRRRHSRGGGLKLRLQPGGNPGENRPLARFLIEGNNGKIHDSASSEWGAWEAAWPKGECASRLLGCCRDCRNPRASSRAAMRSSHAAHSDEAESWICHCFLQ